MAKGTSASKSIATSEEKNILRVIERVRSGITFSNFISLVNKSPFSMDEWARFLHLSERTIQRYQRQEKVFDTIYSDKIVQISLLYKSGVNVFGSKAKFNSWLETKNLALGSKKPKDILDNSFGIELVKDELTKIEYGILS